MKFTRLELAGAWLVEPEPVSDRRGFFARTFCRREFESRGLNPALEQASISFNNAKGTLRGMHYQKAPHAETKLVRCTAGAIYDVIIDLRPDSSTFRRWAGAELSAANRSALYIPEGFAHGFITLAAACEVFYQISEPFHPECAAGVRWNDPVFAIKWPAPPAVISPRDDGYPDFPA